MADRIFIGIDPGKNGAICAITEEGTLLPPMECPLRLDRSIDYPKVLNAVDKKGVAHICIERVHAIPGSSAKGTFEFGGAFYCVVMAADIAAKPYTLVDPQRWQKEMFLGITPIPKPSGRLDTKKMAWMAMQRLFPGEVQKLITGRRTVPHDGVVDAYLIAEYCRRNFR